MTCHTNQCDGGELRGGQVVRRSWVRFLILFAAAMLSSTLGGCVCGFSEKELLGFTPDGKTVFYTTDDKVFIGVVFGMAYTGFGPHSIYLDWRDVDSPRRTGRIRLHGDLIAFPTTGKEKDPPWWAKFSPDSRHVAVDFNNGKVLLVDLKKRTSGWVAGHLDGIGQYEWLSNDEMIFESDLEAKPGDRETRRLCLYRWNIHKPPDDLQLVYEEQGPCWNWSLSPDKSHVLIGPCCKCGQCKFLDLRSGAIRRFGPGNVRLGGCVWISDGSAVFCELKHGPFGRDAERDDAPRQYLLVSPTRSEMILASHRESDPAKLGYLLGFTPDNRYVVTSECLLVQPRPWKIIDLKPGIVKRWKFTNGLKPEFRCFPVPGWFCLWAPDEKIYAVDWQARKFIPLADHGRYAVSPDGKQIAELTSGWLWDTMDIRELNIPDVSTGEEAGKASGLSLQPAD